MAEIDEYTGMTGFINEFREHYDMPFWLRQELDQHITRRKHPGTEFKNLSVNNNDLHKRAYRMDYYVDPFEKHKIKKVE